jgi:hypothetical protein
MGKRDDAPRFGPGRWMTMRETGEHVKVESWSDIAAAYRVHSRKSGLQFATEDDLVEVCAHPDVELGKYWHRCQAPGCGAPLTPELPVCPQCHAPQCTCGRCQCARPAKSARPKTSKAARPKAGSRAR